MGWLFFENVNWISQRKCWGKNQWILANYAENQLHGLLENAPFSSRGSYLKTIISMGCPIQNHPFRSMFLGGFLSHVGTLSYHSFHSRIFHEINHSAN